MIIIAMLDAHHLAHSGLHLVDSALKFLLDPHVSLLQQLLSTCLQQKLSFSEAQQLQKHHTRQYVVIIMIGIVFEWMFL